MNDRSHFVNNRSHQEELPPETLFPLTIKNLII